MKITKKITAIILAAAMLISAASVTCFADETEKDVLGKIGLYCDEKGICFVKGSIWAGIDKESKINLYEISESGENLLIKEFTEDEVYKFETMDPVEMPELSNEKNYCFEISEPYMTEAGEIIYKTDFYDFTCNSLLAETPVFAWHDLYLDENESIDLMSNVLFPLGYEGSVSFEVLTSDEYFEYPSLGVLMDSSKLEGSVLTALNDDELYVELYDNNGEYCDVCLVEIMETEPDSIGESIYDSLENFIDMMMSGLGSLGFSGIFFLFWGIIGLMAPFMVILILLGFPVA